MSTTLECKDFKSDSPYLKTPITFTLTTGKSHSSGDAYSGEYSVSPIEDSYSTSRDSRFGSRYSGFDDMSPQLPSLTSEDCPVFDSLYLNGMPEKSLHYGNSGYPEKSYGSLMYPSQSDCSDNYYPQDSMYSNRAYSCMERPSSYRHNSCDIDYERPYSSRSCRFMSESDIYERDYSLHSSLNTDYDYHYLPTKGLSYQQEKSCYYSQDELDFHPQQTRYLRSFSQVQDWDDISSSHDEISQSRSISSLVTDNLKLDSPAIRSSTTSEEPFELRCDEVMRSVTPTTPTPIMDLRVKEPVHINKIHPKKDGKKMLSSDKNRLGNPDEIDASINPRVFSGKKPKKNMDYSHYIINIHKVKKGEDNRLTLMLKNIPNGFTQDYLIELLNTFTPNQFDFFYMPVDFKTNCNLGFGYVSMINYASVVKLYDALNHKKWPNTPSYKICEVVYARMQGKNDMQKLCGDWAIMELPVKYRPVFFEKKFIKKNGVNVMVMKRVSN